jgi:chitinase
VGIARESGRGTIRSVQCAAAGTNASGCYGRNVDGGDNRGRTSSGDWDFGYWKSECSDGEYIKGVSLRTSDGSPHSVLCCNGGGGGGSGIGSVVSEAQFNAWFPNRNGFYTYQGLVNGTAPFPDFVNSSDMTLRKREAAAFLANMWQESDQLRAINEYNTANYCSYCDGSRSYGCPAGSCNYYGRGPMQVSWNFNYKMAGDWLGIDLLNNPGLIASDSQIAWKTAVWYWMTQFGPGGAYGNCHDAMMNSNGSGGMGATIGHINGSVECPSLGGGNTAARDNRVNYYRYFCDQLGVSYGNNISC